MRRLDHPNIQKIIEIYEDELNIFIILELFNGRSMKTHMATLTHL